MDAIANVVEALQRSGTLWLFVCILLAIISVVVTVLWIAATLTIAMFKHEEEQVTHDEDDATHPAQGRSVSG